MFVRAIRIWLGQVSGLKSAEASNWEPIQPGRIYVAPGDFHMTVANAMGRMVIRLQDTPPENFCRPSVDPMLHSVAECYGGRSLALILTGMGRDGLAGCRTLVEAGGTVIAQDEATSVVWGMPGAVANAGLCTAILPLAQIAPHIEEMTNKAAA